MSSDPPSSGTLDDGWGSVDEPSSQPSEASVALRAPRLPSVSLPEEQGPLRDTLPPPVPVALYVQTMMNQADEDEDADYGEDVEHAGLEGVPNIHAANLGVAALEFDGDPHCWLRKHLQRKPLLLQPLPWPVKQRWINSRGH